MAGSMAGGFRGPAGGSKQRTARTGLPGFRDVSLLGKMLALALTAAALTLVVGVVAQASLDSVTTSSHAIVSADAKPALTLGQSAVYWARYRRFAVSLVVASDATSIKAAQAKLADNKAKAEATVAAYLASGADAESKATVTSLGDDMNKAIDVYESQIAPAAATQTDPVQIAALVKKLEADFSPLADKVTKGYDEVVAANSAQVDKDTATQTSHSRRSTVVLWVAIVLGVFATVLFGVFLARMIVRPIVAVRDALRGLAEGDLTSEVVVHTRDEVGQMAEALGQAQLSLREAMATISSSSGTLAGSAEELSAVSAQVAASAEETSSQSGTAAAAAEQVSRNVQTVAAATEQMSASIREISQSSADAVRVAQSAAVEAQQANATVAKLGDSSREIGDVVKVITSIAEQTNLLALNATIEAARAGEAGKGFAVVASEVKDLAQETARATDDISRRIDAIQTDTEAAVQAIERISQIIDEVNNYQTTIASAVEEQTATTSEMSRNVSDAATGSQSIAENIEYVATSAQSSSSGIGEAQRAASELAQLSAELRELVGRFRI